MTEYLFAKQSELLDLSDIPSPMAVKPTSGMAATGDGLVMLSLNASGAYAEALPFNFTVNRAADNPSITEDNVVHRFGVNMDDNGQPVTAGQPVSGFEIEQRYETGGVYKVESHWVTLDTDATSVRPVSFAFERGSIRTTLASQYRAVRHEFNDADVDNTSIMLIDSENKRLDFANGISLRSSANNVAFMEQRNAADSAFLEIVRVNASDQIVFGAAGSNAGILISNDLLLGNNREILPALGSSVKIGNATTKSALEIRHSGSIALTLDPEGLSTNRWQIKADGNSFELRYGTTDPFQVKRTAPEAALVVDQTFLTAGLPIALKSYTVSTLPTATAGHFIYVSDETGGGTAAWADGTNWRRMSDGAVVS